MMLSYYIVANLQKGLIVKFFKLFSKFKREEKKPEITEEKMSLETAILLREAMTVGYIENWSVAAHAMMSTINATIRHGVRLGYTLEIIVLGEIYSISKENFRTIRVVTINEKINDGNEVIRRYRLEISLTNPDKKGTNITLLVTTSSFNGLYIIGDNSKVDVTGTIPDCRTFDPVCDIYKAVHRKKPTDKRSTGSNVVQFTLPTRNKE